MNFSNEEIEHMCAGIVEESAVGSSSHVDLQAMDRAYDDKNIYYNDMKAAAAGNVNERFYHDEDRSYTEEDEDLGNMFYLMKNCWFQTLTRFFFSSFI